MKHTAALDDSKFSGEGMLHSLWILFWWMLESDLCNVKLIYQPFDDKGMVLKDTAFLVSFFLYHLIYSVFTQRPHTHTQNASCSFLRCMWNSGRQKNDGREMCVHGLINSRRELTVTNMTEEGTSTQVWEVFMTASSQSHAVNFLWWASDHIEHKMTVT